jgi:uncharacterized protein involved in type VI secretion and phage assembly
VTLTLYETIQRLVQRELGRVRTAEVAIVQAQQPHSGAGDKENYSCTVALRDSGIVLKQVPVSSGRLGEVAIPAVGEAVLVQFLGGDVNAPVITGRLYSDGHRPPPSKDGQAVLHLPLDAGDDDAVHMELTSGDTRVLKLKLGKGLALTLQDDDPAVSVDVGDGKAKLTIAQDGTVTLEAQALTVKSKDKLDVKGQGDVSIQAQGQLTLKGSTVNIN